MAIFIGLQSKAKSGAPDRIRTCGLCLRRATLYPAELRAQSPARTTGRLLLERAAKKWKPVFRRKGARRIRPDRIAQTGMRIGGERMPSRYRQEPSTEDRPDRAQSTSS